MTAGRTGAPLRVLVVGAGVWGRQHARAWSSRTDSELVGIVGRTPQRVQRRAERYGVPAFTDLAAALAATTPDLVSLSLPNLEHTPATLQVLEAGLPVLAEKPLAFTLEEADQLLAVAGDTSFAVNFNHRYAEPVLRAETAVRAGLLGDLVFATWRFGGQGSSAHHPHANLIETQCHGFDLLEHLCGPVTTVSAETTGVGSTDDGQGTCVLALRFASGALASLVGTYDSSYAYPGAWALELNGTRGRVTATDTVARYTFQEVGSDTAQVWQPGYFDDPGRSFTQTMDRHLDALVPTVVAGQPPPVPAERGRRALELALAAVTSAETGRRVQV